MNQVNRVLCLAHVPSCKTKNKTSHSFELVLPKRNTFIGMAIFKLFCASSWDHLNVILV